MEDVKNPDEEFTIKDIDETKTKNKGLVSNENSMVPKNPNEE